MISFFQKKYTEWKIRYQLHKYLRPDRGFLIDARQKFIENIPERKPLSFWNIQRVAISVLIVLVIINGTAIVYAQKADVGPKNFLYGYKRTAENIQTSITPHEEQNLLHQQFASKRLAELKKLKNDDPADENIPQLKNDFKEEVKLMLEDIPSAASSLRDIRCRAAKEEIDEYDNNLETGTQWSRFNKLCKNSSTSTISKKTSRENNDSEQD